MMGGTLASAAAAAGPVLVGGAFFIAAGAFPRLLISDQSAASATDASAILRRPLPSTAAQKIAGRSESLLAGFPGRTLLLAESAGRREPSTNISPNTA